MVEVLEDELLDMPKEAMHATLNVRERKGVVSLGYKLFQDFGKVKFVTECCKRLQIGYFGTKPDLTQQNHSFRTNISGKNSEKTGKLSTRCLSRACVGSQFQQEV